jgi:hypothetical protein
MKGPSRLQATWLKLIRARDFALLAGRSRSCRTPGVSTLRGTSLEVTPGVIQTRRRAAAKQGPAWSSRSGAPSYARFALGVLPAGQCKPNKELARRGRQVQDIRKAWDKAVKETGVNRLFTISDALVSAT